MSCCFNRNHTFKEYTNLSQVRLNFWGYRPSPLPPLRDKYISPIPCIPTALTSLQRAPPHITLLATRNTPRIKWDMVQNHEVSHGQAGTWIQVQVHNLGYYTILQEKNEKEKETASLKNQIFLNEYKQPHDLEFDSTAAQTIPSQDSVSKLKHSCLKPPVIPHHLLSLGPNKRSNLTALRCLSLSFIWPISTEHLCVPALCWALASLPRMSPAWFSIWWKASHPSRLRASSSRMLSGTYIYMHAHTHVHVHTHSNLLQKYLQSPYNPLYYIFSCCL